MFSSGSPDTGQHIARAVEALNHHSEFSDINSTPMNGQGASGPVGQNSDIINLQIQQNAQQKLEQHQYLMNQDLQLTQINHQQLLMRDQTGFYTAHHQGQPWELHGTQPQQWTQQLQGPGSSETTSNKTVSTLEWQQPRKRKKHAYSDQPIPTPSNVSAPVFTHKNQYAVLEDKSEVETPKKPPIDHNIPPIFVQSVTNVSKLIEFLKLQVKDEDFTYKMYSEDVKVLPKTIEAYRAIIKQLDESEAKYHTYQPKKDRAFRVVLRYLHPSANIEEVKAELKSKGHTVRNMHNVLHRVSKKPLSLFFIDLEPSANNAEIYNIDTLVNAEIEFEAPYKKKIPVQCHRCQEYGHTKKYCKATPRCVKCGEEHFTDECKKDATQPATCALCSRSHPANYKGCQVYQDYVNKRNKHRKETDTIDKKKQKVPNASDFPPLPVRHFQPNPFSRTASSQNLSYAVPYNQNQTDLCKIIETSFQKFESILKQQSEQIGALLNLLTSLISKMH